MARWIEHRIRTGLATRPGVRVIERDRVIELTVTDRDKGHAPDTLRVDTGASAVVYLGRVAIRVGGGDSQARYRVADTPAVADALELLRDLRAAPAR